MPQSLWQWQTRLRSRDEPAFEAEVMTSGLESLQSPEPEGHRPGEEKTS